MAYRYKEHEYEDEGLLVEALRKDPNIKHGYDEAYEIEKEEVMRDMEDEIRSRVLYQLEHEGIITKVNRLAEANAEADKVKAKHGLI